MRHSTVGRFITALFLCGALSQNTFGDEVEFEIGGPLAGVKLPPMPTQHGEEPGYPGCLPELMARGEIFEDMGNRYREFGPQGQAREWELYDGSVEHWRAYMMKYLPVRSFFDRQSLVKNWVAPNIPGASRNDATEFAEPVYWVPRHSQPQATGRHCKPVPVVRLRPGAPLLKLDLGTLDTGVYVVRVIGAVETDKLRTLRRPLLVRMRVNDGPAGETTEYVRRVGYCDQFYSVAEIYFHAPVRRNFRTELQLDPESQVDLLVANVTLDDALAGARRQAIKSRTTIKSAVPAARAALANRQEQGATISEPLDRQTRFEMDEAIWNQFPPLNTQGSSIRPGGTGYGAVPGVTAGTEQLDGKQIEDQFGKWEPPPLTGEVTVGEGANAKAVPAKEVFAVNRKLGLVYTVDDFRQHRPLPDPYPVKDTGTGVITLSASDEGKAAAWTPIGGQVQRRRKDYYSQAGRMLTQYKQRGDYDLAHEAALRLIRFAYDFPTFDPSDSIDNCIRDPGRYGRDLSCRRRPTIAAFLPHYPLYVKPYLFWYDELFDFIKDNKTLAESVGRFVPWVKSPDDVIRLIDVYLVQTTAKRIMRYHYHTDVADLANLAAIVGNRQVTAPWMEWLFSRTFVYPLPVAGIQDVMISGCNREGTEFVGSTFYAQGEGAARVARSLDLYLRAGGDPDYDLSDSSRYPKPASHAYWRIENVVAGADFLRVGDVCGPDKVPGHTLRDLEFARSAWKWTKDPAFAFILRHYLEPTDETDQQWQEIERAADGQPRAPWLQNRSRVLPYWAGVLEAGTDHDDYRFRRAAYVRLGFGAGHHHNDTLDLQVFAHGLPMTIDGGQRPGYSKPGDRTTSLHNVVQVDGLPAYRHSWARTLADAPGARYLSADAAPAPNISLIRRQVALIDVDAVGTPQKLLPEQQLPGSELPPVAVTPHSYLFDVFRVDGGQRHMYCFHGPLNDDFQWNATRVGKPAAGSDEESYLARYNRMPELTFTGDAPATLEATWQMAVEVDGPGGGEKEMLRKNYVPDVPRKFTRVHLLGTAGLRAMRAECVCRQWNYHYTNLMVRESDLGGPTHRTYVALIEPYVGKPVITSRRELKITDNEHDARRAVAVEVRTAHGNKDVCFADARPDRVRELPDAKIRVAGEFACYGTDAAGLRQATLVGGRILETPLVRIQPAAAERCGNVTKVDYHARKLWIDQPWPRRTAESVFEVGLPDHWTTYTAVRVDPAPGGTCLTLKRGADFFRSPVTQIDPDNRHVQCTLKPLLEFVDHNRHGWVTSNEQQSTFWRASYLGNGAFELHGPQVEEQSFGAEGVLRLWEYGVGDRVRQSTAVSLTRIDKDLYQVTTDVDAEISLPGKRVEMSTDSKTFRPLAATAADGWNTFEIPARDDPTMLRLAD